MISISLQDLILNYQNVKFLKLYDLPTKSPFVESEKIYLDILKKMDEKSSLYFFFLQLNSSSGIDYDSLNTWFKIKFIPISEIKEHLLCSRYPFFFTYEKSGNIGAFLNPQNLIISFNVSYKVGYTYEQSLEDEINENNSVKLLFCKFHEIAHSKFNFGSKNDVSPRYLYNSKLEPLDTHYDTIYEYKNGKKPTNSDKRGEDVGEEGYALEMFLYGNYALTDLLLDSNDDLKQFLNSNLYIQDNLNELNHLFIELMKNSIFSEKYSEEEKKINELKIKIERKKNTSLANNIELSKKTPIYFFHNHSIDSRY